MKELVFTYTADVDIQNAFGFLEDIKEGLGDRFLESLERALGQIQLFPESGPLIRGRHRRVFTPRFPYGVFYTVYPRRVVITGVFHLRLGKDEVLHRLDS